MYVWKVPEVRETSFTEQEKLMPCKQGMLPQKHVFLIKIVSFLQGKNVSICKRHTDIRYYKYSGENF